MAESKAQASGENTAPSPAGTAPGASPHPPVTALENAPEQEYLSVLERSNAWTALTDGVDLKYGDGVITGPDKGLNRQTAGRLLALGRNVLEANGYVVDGQYEPNLVIRVMGV